MEQTNNKTSWKIFSNYEDIWGVMLRDISNAKESICFEQYIFTDFEEGSIGRKFLEAFQKRASVGVKVRLVIDAQGSYKLPIEILKENENNIEIIYHTISTHRWNIFLKSVVREHRKLLIIDNHIAHVGGAIMQDRAHAWGELNVRFEGGIVDELREVFMSAWNGLKNSNTFITPKPTHLENNFNIVGSSPLKNEHYVFDSILEKIKSAKHVIKITSPYFVPPRKLLIEILNARKRGVDIEMILPEEIDNIVSKYSSFEFYDRVLKSGIKIFLFDTYIHAKSVIVDGVWSTFGSTNMDNMSLLHNYELNVESTDADFLIDLSKNFESYKIRCRPLTLTNWRSRSFITKVLEKLFIIFRPIA